MAGGGPDNDCVLMKFLMLCILVCLNLPSKSMLDFFFMLSRGASRLTLAGDGLRTDDRSNDCSMLITLSEYGAATWCGFPSVATKLLAVCDANGFASAVDSICRRLDVADLGGFTIIVLMFLTENRGAPPPETPLPVTDTTDGR